MTAPPSAQTLKCQSLEREYQALRIEKRTGLQTLARIAEDAKAFVDQQKEATRRRMEHKRREGFTRSVLVLDDDAMQRSMIRATLQMTLQVPVYVAATQAEAHEVWAKYRCSTAVVDLLLGIDGTGDEFVNDLVHGVRVIMVSGTDLLTLKSAAALCNAIPISKEDLGEKLAPAVLECLDKTHPPLWCRADRDTFVEVSDAFAALLGVPPPLVQGQSWRSFVHPEDLARSEAERVRRVGLGVEGFVQRLKARDGYVALRWDVTPMTDGLLYAEATRV